jgi:4-hydroxy-3-methylbut-2-enyl diphosphate reductase IspH
VSIGITGGTSTPEVDLEAVRDRIYALTARRSEKAQDSRARSLDSSIS